ncbi:nitrate- and nitrite sensing domain-containing protein [Plantactinospora sp. CA-290183]|uniref:nitrate- and nitrite sensing domain-containing protein n=1 Tax=Plantactinospora sp. CA-290183 TaxID=3240006 RepID=UPI003D94057E
MLLGRLRIRGKLALLVVIPLLSTIGLAVPVLADRIELARRAADTEQTVRTANRVGTIVQDLQRERLLSIGYLLGVVDRSALVQQGALVADRIADLRADLGDELPSQIDRAIGGVRALAELRGAVLARRAAPDQVITAFGQLDTTLIDSLRLVGDADATTPEGRQVIALDAVLRADEGISACAALIVLVVAAKSPTAGTAYVATMARLQTNLARFRSFATPAQSDLYRLVEEAVAARTSRDFLSVGSLNPAGAVAGLSLERLFPAVSSLITLGQFVEKKMVADVVAEVTDERRRAIAGAYTVGLLVLLIIAMMALLSLAVARTVARPLTRLTVSAERMARVAEAELVRIADDESEAPDPIRLDPVDVGGRDEIGDLARAFERVQGTAARLVERQTASRRNVAQMFGHVGRRTQNLVGRQIALIDRLEERETDPTRLQHLYRLDHVSSRLRRNAGSLVVLSGAAGGDGHDAPLPLGDVVRLALGEIEDYTRVDVLVRLDVAVAPGVIGDLVLTLAELMENATAFSPPHTRVTVLAEVLPGAVRINLVDHGIGMSAERLAEENARLTRRERLDLAPTELLGLFVVGRLARRHGWRVTLTATPGGGVTAGVEISDRLLIARRPEPPTVATAPNARPGAAQELPSPVGVTSPVGMTSPVGTAEPAVGAGGPARRTVTEPAPEPLVGAAVAAGPAPTARSAPVTPAAPAFDTALLSRATRSLAAGQPWNAFATSPATGVEAGPGAAPAPAAAVDTARTGGTPNGPGPASPGPGTGLRQRVPGAQLPTDTRRGRPTPTPADPSVVRALIEEFEAGVRRAQRQQQLRAGTGPGPRPEPSGPAGGPAHPEPAAGTGPGPTATTEDTSTTAAPGAAAPPRLNRRVPGANLSVPPTGTRTGPAPGHVPATPESPAQVRELITQFESGVARALSEVRSDRRHEEGSAP